MKTDKHTCCFCCCCCCCCCQSPIPTPPRPKKKWTRPNRPEKRTPKRVKYIPGHPAVTKAQSLPTPLEPRVNTPPTRGYPNFIQKLPPRRLPHASFTQKQQQQTHIGMMIRESRTFGNFNLFVRLLPETSIKCPKTEVFEMRMRPSPTVPIDEMKERVAGFSSLCVRPPHIVAIYSCPPITGRRSSYNGRLNYLPDTRCTFRTLWMPSVRPWMGWKVRRMRSWWIIHAMNGYSRGPLSTDFCPSLGTSTKLRNKYFAFCEQPPYRSAWLRDWPFFCMNAWTLRFK